MLDGFYRRETMADATGTMKTSVGDKTGETVS